MRKLSLQLSALSSELPLELWGQLPYENVCRRLSCQCRGLSSNPPFWLVPLQILGKQSPQSLSTGSTETCQVRGRGGADVIKNSLWNTSEQIVPFRKTKDWVQGQFSAPAWESVPWSGDRKISLCWIWESGSGERSDRPGRAGREVWQTVWGQDPSLPLSLPASLSLFLPSFLPINNSWVPVEPGQGIGSELENKSNPALASRTQKFSTMTLVSHIEISTGVIRKSPWCWERLRAEGEEGIRGWDGWMASLMQWTWTWANSRRWWVKGGLECCSPWGRKESDTTGRLNNNNDNRCHWAQRQLSLGGGSRGFGSIQGVFFQQRWYLNWILRGIGPTEVGLRRAWALALGYLGNTDNSGRARMWGRWGWRGSLGLKHFISQAVVWEKWIRQAHGMSDDLKS